MPGAASIRKKMYAEKSAPKSITSDARKSQMPILAFQSPVSGRVETVYGISIALDLSQNRFDRRLSANTFRRFHGFVLHREIAFASGETVFVGTAIGHRRMNEISMWRW